MRAVSFLTLLVLCGCQNSDHEASDLEAISAPSATQEVTYTDGGDPEGLHRFRQWSDTLYQGAQPEGDKAFRNLAALGVTTVISVDGVQNWYGQ